jgi:hypothetical protein
MSKYIYLIQSNLNGEYSYKIGKTSRNINKRLFEIKTSNPGKLTILYTYFTNNADVLEKALHNHYNYLKISNEWFKNINLQNFIETIKILDNSLNIIK